MKIQGYEAEKVLCGSAFVNNQNEHDLQSGVTAFITISIDQPHNTQSKQNPVEDERQTVILKILKRSFELILSKILTIAHLTLAKTNFQLLGIPLW